MGSSKKYIKIIIHTGDRRVDLRFARVVLCVYAYVCVLARECVCLYLFVEKVFVRHSAETYLVTFVSFPGSKVFFKQIDFIET